MRHIRLCEPVQLVGISSCALLGHLHTIVRAAQAGPKSSYVEGWTSHVRDAMCLRITVTSMFYALHFVL